MIGHGPVGRAAPLHRHPVARLLWVATGVAAGIALALLLAAPSASPLFMASLGGSAVFLFGLRTR